MVHSQVSVIPENVSRAMLVELRDWACKLTEQGSIEWALRSQGKQTPGLTQVLPALLCVRHDLY